MRKQYRSGALAGVHETAQGLADAGAIDKQTMKSFDALCLLRVMASAEAPEADTPLLDRS